MKPKFTDRDAVLYLTGMLDAVAAGPHFTAERLAVALIQYHGRTEHLRRTDSILADFILAAEAGPGDTALKRKRRRVAAQLHSVLRHPERLRPDHLKEDEL
jgi:hypothetical protein